MTSRRNLLGGIAGAIGSSWARMVGAGAAPNIVFVLIDDVRFDDLGVSGPSWIKTPSVDRIAREGVLFENAFVTSPLCSPSRASFLTGQYAHVHGILDNEERGPLSHQLVTFPSLLHDRGYETGFIGKWHMGTDDTPRPGFDYWLSMKGLGAYINPEVNENGKRSQIHGYLTEVLNDRAVRFLRKKRDKPFCLLLSHKAVNPDSSYNPDGSVDPNSQVFRPAERHKTLYTNGVSIPRRPNYLKAPVDKPALQRRVEGVPPLSSDTGTEDEVIKNRLRMLASADDGVGEIFDTLKRSGKLDTTFFVFASDHGFFYGEHCLSNERRLAYEESIHVPILIRYPRLIRPGKRESRFVLGIDLAPTILELAGAPVPRWMHGRSLLPLFAANGHEWRKAFLIEYFSDRKMRRIDHMGYQAIRTERWKYIHYTELKAMDELYDLAADPYEMRNLVNDAGASQAREDLRVQLNSLLAESRSRR